jgi:hypothetical protein
MAHRIGDSDRVFGKLDGYVATTAKFCQKVSSICQLPRSNIAETDGRLDYEFPAHFAISESGAWVSIGVQILQAE